MESVTNKPMMMRVVTLNVIMVGALPPWLFYESRIVCVVTSVYCLDDQCSCRCQQKLYVLDNPSV
jgi:hypothetical protein